MASALDDLRKALHQDETGAANLLASTLHGRAVFDHSEKLWYLWDTFGWAEDRTHQVGRYVSQDVAAEFLHLAAEERKQGSDLHRLATKRAIELGSRRMITNVLAIAATNPKLARTGDEWDSAPWLLATPNGIIDLQTGQTVDIHLGKSAHLRSMTKVGWQGFTPAPHWLNFLNEIFDGDQDRIAYVQRLLGYGITGLSTERVFPILAGNGSNGKTTMLEVIGEVLGPALTLRASADALMASDRLAGDGPRPFLVRLRGKRLVWCSESDEDAKLDAGLIKWATGNDTIVARDLFSKPITFAPSHLLLLLTNHTPAVSSDDQALWDRLALIEFSQRFVDDPHLSNERTKDPMLKERLLAEGPGILAWLVEGCLAWQREGLKPPASVKLATNQYRNQQDDPLAGFLKHDTEEGTGFSATAAALYARYEIWEIANRNKPMTANAFGRKLGKRYTRHTNASGNIEYLDVRLI